MDSHYLRLVKIENEMVYLEWRPVKLTCCRPLYMRLGDHSSVEFVAHQSEGKARLDMTIDSENVWVELFHEVNGRELQDYHYRWVVRRRDVPNNLFLEDAEKGKKVYSYSRGTAPDRPYTAEEQEELMTAFLSLK